MPEISFHTSNDDADLIFKVVDRAWKMTLALLGGRAPSFSRADLSMDITACHANGTPLRLADLLEADAANFSHDVFGILRHINRETGQLEDSFVPRFAVPAPDLGRTLDGEVYEVKKVE